MPMRLLFLVFCLGVVPAFGQSLSADAEYLAKVQALAADRPAEALAALPKTVVPELRCEQALLRAELLEKLRPAEAVAALPGEDCPVGLQIAALELELRLAPNSNTLRRWLELRGQDYARSVAQAAEGKTGLQIQKILNKDGELLAKAWKRLLDSGDPKAATELYLRFPQTPEGSRIGRQQAGSVTEDDLYVRGRILAALGRFEAAVKVLDELERNSKNASIVNRCLLELGQLHDKLRNTALCTSSLERLLKRIDPQSADGQQARFVLARNFYRRVASRRGEALPLLEGLTDSSTTSPQVRDQAFQLRVGILRESSATPQAIKLLRAEGDRKDSLSRQWALEKLGWIYIDQKNWKAAVEAYEALLAVPATGEPRVAGLYWTGRALENLGDTAQARKFYGQAAAEFPLHWYGLHALERWQAGGPGKLPAPPPLPLAAKLDSQSLPAARATEILVLMSAKLWRFADWELEDAARHEPENLQIQLRLAQVHAAQGDYETSTFLAQRSFGGFRYSAAAPTEVLKLLYPLPYADDLRRYASESKVPAAMAAGLIHQESGFFSHVVSAAGAVGLMQMMPSTAGNTAAQMGIKNFKQEQLFQPAMNLRLGLFHLGELLRSFGGAKAPTIASYNAGPQKARQWWKRGGTKDLARFVEGIPYSETRDYVKKVLGKAEAYRRLYPELQTPIR